MPDDPKPPVHIRHYPFPEYPSILCVLESGGPGPQKSDKHSHPWAQINVVLEGHATWYTDEGAFMVGVGDAFLLLPGAPHHAEVDVHGFCRSGTLEFVFGGEQEPHSNPSIPAPGYAGRPRSQAIRWLFDTLSRKPVQRLTWDGFPDWWGRITREEQVVGGPYRALRLEGAMLEALSAFADPALRVTHRGQNEEVRRMERVQEYISENLSTSPLTVNELARVAGMSRSRLTVRFTKEVGMPPHSYVNALRIWTAQTALAGSSSSFAEIAKNVRFSSPQHFSRAFKEATGLTPSEYRRRWAAPWLRDS
ncbi:MAG: helix-turn-helix transcriptional regulator [Verrucomicrobia bacterium]|nr:helix-turn-helix transcriptional regulator [Verrucomicrobiota bacterium]